MPDDITGGLSGSGVSANDLLSMLKTLHDAPPPGASKSDTVSPQGGTTPASMPNMAPSGSGQPKSVAPSYSLNIDPTLASRQLAPAPAALSPGTPSYGRDMNLTGVKDSIVPKDFSKPAAEPTMLGKPVSKWKDLGYNLSALGASMTPLAQRGFENMRTMRQDEAAQDQRNQESMRRNKELELSVNADKRAQSEENRKARHDETMRKIYESFGIPKYLNPKFTAEFTARQTDAAIKAADQAEAKRTPTWMGEGVTGDTTKTAPGSTGAAPKYISRGEDIARMRAEAGDKAATAITPEAVSKASGIPRMISMNDRLAANDPAAMREFAMQVIQANPSEAGSILPAFLKAENMHTVTVKGPNGEDIPISADQWFKTTQKNEHQSVNFQSWGITKDGLVVSYNPKTAGLEVTSPDGTKEPYNKAKHGDVFNKTNGSVMNQMTDEQLDFYADKYLQDWTLPSTGIGGAGKIQIMQRAAEKAKAQGLTGKEAAIRSALYKANTKALENDVKMYDQMRKSELQAHASGELLQASSASLGRTNIRFANSLAGLARNAVNDPALADFKMKLLAFSREYYKVTTNAYASVQELSVGAQQQADKMLSEADSWESLDTKINAAYQEMDNTNVTFSQTIGERRQAMGEDPSKKVDAKPKKGAAKGEATATTLPAEARSKLKEGKATTFKNGQVWTLVKGKPMQINAGAQ